MNEKEQIVYQPQAKNNSMTLIPPEGCEVEKTEIVDGALVVTFKPKEPQLPKSWEEFCETNPRAAGEAYISTGSEIYVLDDECGIRQEAIDRNLLPDRETADAVLALCQLIQLRECYNQGWKPNWKDDEKIYMIIFVGDEITINWFRNSTHSPLYFKTEELRDMFLENFRQLIEKLKPLYGIKLK